MTDAYAQLLVDTALGAASLGCRGPAAERQLVYRHAGVQLDLMLQRGGPEATFVWGQLCRIGSGRPCEGATVALSDEDGRPVAEATTDAFGEFSFAVPRAVEGALRVSTPTGLFLCWVAPRDGADARPLGSPRR